MSSIAANPEADRPAGACRPGSDVPPCESEASRAERHPISCWYACPLAARLTSLLAGTRIRPDHLTLLGFALGAAGGAVLVGWPQAGPLAAALVFAAWFCDRMDGLLARRKGSESAWGAWLDGNVDELVDIGLHIALALAAGTQAAWCLVIGFLAGKYLFLYGLASERELAADPVALGTPAEVSPVRHRRGLLRSLYHLPGNADVRLHVLVIALACEWYTAELTFVAAYFNLRWIVRYGLVARRLGGGR